LTSSPDLMTRIHRLGPVRKFDRWLHATPNPGVVVEIASNYVAAAHGSSVATEMLPAGSVMPSPMETNITQPGAVKTALDRVLDRVSGRGSSVALLVPDPVVRIFILSFETFPRNQKEALPLLRWRLKKSVPFDVDESILSWMRQNGRLNDLEIVAAIARQRIVREYEELLDSFEARAGVVVSSTLAALPLLEEDGPILMIRMSGKTLTTAVSSGANLCVYRSSEMASEVDSLDPQVMLEEIFPAAAYYQDTYGSPVRGARLSGFGDRAAVFSDAVTKELKVSAAPLSESASRLDSSSRDLVRQNLDAIAGWIRNSAAS